MGMAEGDIEDWASEALISPREPPDSRADRGAEAAVGPLSEEEGGSTLEMADSKDDSSPAIESRRWKALNGWMCGEAIMHKVKRWR